MCPLSVSVTPDYGGTQPGGFFLPGTSSLNVKSLNWTLPAGQSCSRFLFFSFTSESFSGQVRLRCVHADTHLETQPAKQTLMSLKASSLQRCSAFWQEQRTWWVSVVSVFPRANNHRLLQNKDLQKDYCTPLDVIYLESKRKRHMKHRTELSE